MMTIKQALLHAEFDSASNNRPNVSLTVIWIRNVFGFDGENKKLRVLVNGMGF